MHLALDDELGCRKRVAPIGVRAVERERVELAGLVPAIDETVTVPAARVQPTGHDIPHPVRPLALNSQQPRPQVQDQVIALVIERTGDTKTEFKCGCGNLRLGNRALLIRRQHCQQR
jgi:hypothetical protein